MLWLGAPSYQGTEEMAQHSWTCLDSSLFPEILPTAQYSMSRRQ